MNIFKKIISILKNRFICFFIILFVILSGNYLLNGKILPSTDNSNLWFYSGLIMLLLSIFFIEPYYTSPKNVITNTIPILMVFLAIKDKFKSNITFNIIFWIIFTLLVLSIISLVSYQKNKSQAFWLNKLSNFLKKIVIFLGNGKIIFSSIFLFFLYLNIKDIENLINLKYFFLLISIWGIILTINPSNLSISLLLIKKEKNHEAIGEIFGIQSKKMFLAKLFEDKKSTKKFDIVNFRYSMYDDKNSIIIGIVFDIYLLNKEMWIKVLELERKEINSLKLIKNIVYKINDQNLIYELTKELNIDNFVGAVIDNSTINKIKFEYSKKVNDLQEGDLLELEIKHGNDEKRVFYQIVSGITEKKRLEEKNEMGYIKVEAIQLGELIEEEIYFKKFCWVPEINTPIFKAYTKDFKIKEIKYPEFKIGYIPDTNLPVIIDLKIAISYHLAILGVTGSGKSFIAREIIKILQEDTKIICIDITGEWEKGLKKEKINFDFIKEVDDNKIENILKNDKKIYILQLEEIDNYNDLINKIKEFFENIFDIAKYSFQNKNLENVKNILNICIILEEAHTIIPETFFINRNNQATRDSINKISQIALQGRKYGIGLIIIAQRTANVSKSVLTQCNTIISFQAFDETSLNFLRNYIGNDLIQAIPNLPQYHAIIAGKALKSNIPMIVDLTRYER